MLRGKVGYILSTEVLKILMRAIIYIVQKKNLNICEISTRFVNILNTYISKHLFALSGNRENYN